MGKWLYHKERGQCYINDDKGALALGSGWTDNPADWEPKPKTVTPPVPSPSPQAASAPIPPRRGRPPGTGLPRGEGEKARRIADMKAKLYGKEAEPSQPTI